jgi:hypothetical protein
VKAIEKRKPEKKKQKNVEKWEFRTEALLSPKSRASRENFQLFMLFTRG